MSKEIRLFAGITKDDELYFLEIENNKERGFSMAGFTITPISNDDGEAMAKERLEDGELWREAVANGGVEKGLDEWVEEVLAIDGWQHVLDTSLYPDEVEINGKDYSFLSGGCGQHQIKELKEYFIDRKDFDVLMKLWDKHLFKKKIDDSLIPAIQQDELALVEKATKKVLGF